MSSSAHTSSNESRRSTASPRFHTHTRRHKHSIAPRNFQCKQGVRLVDRLSRFQCPVIGCDHVQKNPCVRDLERDIAIHGRWFESDKWICCGVAMNNAHLHGIVIDLKDMGEEELAKAGVYMFRGKLMVGGCLKTSARRDVLKRHVDNPTSLVYQRHGFVFLLVFSLP